MFVSLDHLWSLSNLCHSLCRTPVVEPDGALVNFRNRGLQSGLYGFIQHMEDAATQLRIIRGELELYCERGEWCLETIGTLADDSLETGDWTDCDDFFSSRLHSSKIVGLEIDEERI